MEFDVVFTCLCNILLYVAIVELSEYDVCVQFLKSVNFCHADTAMLDGKLKKYNSNKSTDQLRRSTFLYHVSCPIPAGECRKIIVK